MVTFQPRGGLGGMAAFTDHLRLCDIGVSLGDVHTLVYPRPKDGGIIRLSIGCEDIDDLLEDFELGLSFVPGD
jgi:methionine-gamma-lyase